ncbi:poly-beta-1,6-N-acetyl-D-glucosamine biosynthesis protein PgaD [Acinetobacter indicus]|uniref:poly-beta-1,6-N-acetyl-D-glucosamine biosynthesis protein PgaD n=1 Tax=Acinetobacter indicus TaxID=756892 RepID=UPI000CEC771B|nr:poly-beta-1,6-N-acetyl-D-glucosamine biosynthesis protein PgaD [Acinetobacter indicus]
MKANTLIIDYRYELPWQKRYASNVCTAGLWLTWGLLWQPVLSSLGLLDLERDALIQQVAQLMLSILQNGFSALVACGLSLWLWTNYIPAHSIQTMQPAPLNQFTEHFQLEPVMLTQSRQAKIVTVYHDQEGKIVDLQAHSHHPAS